MSNPPVSTPAPSPAPSPAPAPAATGRPNRGNRRRYNNQNNNNTNNNSRFVPKIATIESLVSSSENKGQDFTKFQKSIHHHALTTFKNSKDISKAILQFVDPHVEFRQNKPNLSKIRTENNLHPNPPVIVPPATEEDENIKFARETENSDKYEMAKMLFSSQIRSNAERERDLTQNLTILWATIMGQCSPALQEEVKGHPEYIAKSVDFHSIWLLETLQKITAGVNNTTNMYFSAFKATKKFYLTQQGGHENVDEYYNRFDNATDLVHLFNADIVDIEDLLRIERVNDATITKETVLQKYMAVALVLNANKSKYESLWNKLENDLLVGQDSYPTTIGAATHLLTNWRVSNNNNNNRNGQGDGTRNTNNDGGGAPPAVNFAQAQVPLPVNRDFF